MLPTGIFPLGTGNRFAERTGFAVLGATGVWLEAVGVTLAGGGTGISIGVNSVAAEVRLEGAPGDRSGVCLTTISRVGCAAKAGVALLEVGGGTGISTAAAASLGEIVTFGRVAAGAGAKVWVEVTEDWEFGGRETGG